MSQDPELNGISLGSDSVINYNTYGLRRRTAVPDHFLLLANLRGAVESCRVILIAVHVHPREKNTQNLDTFAQYKILQNIVIMVIAGVYLTVAPLLPVPDSRITIRLPSETTENCSEF